MTKKQYNIIWGDDQINEVLTDDLRDFLDSLQIKVINESTNAEDLGIFLKSNADKIDAVITDANYSRDRNNKVNPDPNSELITGGLQYVMTLREMYPSKPFFICTQRKPEKLRERFNDGELIPFEGKIFDKTLEDYEIFFPEIVNEIEKRKTPEFIIRNRYHKELSVLHGIRYRHKSVTGEIISVNSEKQMQNWLVADYKGKLDETSDLIKHLRAHIEGIWQELKNKGLIPSFLKLARFKTFFNQEVGVYKDYTTWDKDKRIYVKRFYKINRTFSHPALEHLITYFLDFTNDGVHFGEDSKFEISGYVSSNGNRPYVFKSLMYFALEIIAWANDLIEMNKNCNSDKIWTADPYGRIISLTDIEKKDNDWFYGDTLLKPKDTKFIEAGDKDIIIGAVTEIEDNSSPFNFFYPIPGLVGEVKLDHKNRISVFDCLIMQDEIERGDFVQLVNVETVDPKDNAGYSRIATVRKCIENILRDEEGNWYSGKILIKPSSKKSINTPPVGTYLLGKVGTNNGVLKEKYPLIARGQLIESINVSVFPGYILEVKQREGVLTASNCLVEGDDIKEGDTVVVKDVVSNGDTTTNKMYKAKLIVELYKEESDGNKECKETTE